MLQNKKNEILKNTAAIFLALLVWQIAASAFDSRIIFATPISVASELLDICIEGKIFVHLLFTFSRIAIGFLSALLAGVLLASLAGRFSILETMFFPYMLTVKSVPVASFVIIAIFLFSSSGLSAFVSFLIVLPIIYTNVLSGIKNTDKKMLEVAKVYNIPMPRRLLYVYVPSVKNYLISACRIAIGLAWKSGIAAEIIGVPSGSLGESLYYSKIHLDAEYLFAVTVIIVAASVICEKVFTAFLKWLFSAIERL